MHVIASPCVGICRIDEPSGYRAGCGRTADELAAWRTMSESMRRHVWGQLPARFPTLGIRVSRLPWLPGDIQDFVEEALRQGRGTWVLGVHGAVGEFRCDTGETVTVSRSGNIVEAVTARAALRLVLDDDIHALRVDGGAVGPDKIVLAVPKAKRLLRALSRLSARGFDTEAIREDDRQSRLFDLGLGRSTVRFCVRTCSPGFAREMLSLEGAAWPSYLESLASVIIAASPTRVVETRIGRIEVDTPIPSPGGRTPDGPHTHLLPDRLALDRDSPPGLDLPEAYVLGAIYYP